MSPMVYGYRKALAKARLWVRILGIGVRAYGTPLRAMRVIRQMVEHRSKIKRWTTRKYAFVGGRYFWNLYAPGFPSRAFDRYIEHELDRIKPFRQAPPALQTAIFAITKSCSLQCEHCCEWLALNRPEVLSRTDLLSIVEQLTHCGVTQILFSGGEPLRRFDDLINLAQLAGSTADVWIITSGVGLAATRARMLRAAGVTGVLISLDHWDEAQHDRFRGFDGAFRAVGQAAAAAQSADLVVGLSLCATREFVSRENLERYAETARSLQASFIQLLEPKQVGRYAHEEVGLSRRQQQILERFCDRLNQQASGRGFPAVSYADYASRATRCFGAGDRHLYIDTDGSLHACPFCRGSCGSALPNNLDASLSTMRLAGCQVQH